jgi:spore maturation protein CgeB
MRIVFLGLSITSSWGNGHATTYRALVRELVRRGHDVLFLERDVPWYANSRDLPNPPYGRTELYGSLSDLRARFSADVAAADLVILGSYVPDGVATGEWLASAVSGKLAFYDIDTPVTLSKLERRECEYVTAELIPEFDLYLSFTGGPTLKRIERVFCARRARVLYCSVDPEQYYPEHRTVRWDMGYLGTYSSDRQRVLECLMLEPARRWSSGGFIVAGSMYPADTQWPANVQRVDHLPPSEHREFYNSQRMTLNVTRADMREAGYSPSVRLFEAAACGAAIVSDDWPGIESIFEPESEILISRCPEDSLEYLRRLPAAALEKIGGRARSRVLREHTGAERARQLESYVRELD